jgi:hypothetical protein
LWGKPGGPQGSYERRNAFIVWCGRIGELDQQPAITERLQRPTRQGQGTLEVFNRVLIVRREQERSPEADASVSTRPRLELCP